MEKTGTEKKKGSPAQGRLAAVSLLALLPLFFLTPPAAVAADWPTFRGNAARTGCVREQAAPPFSEEWTFPASGAIVSSPVTYRGYLYFGTRNGYIYALNARTGAMLWSFHTLNWVDSTPAVSSGTLYAASMDGHLYALNALTGRQVWRADLTAPSDSSPLVSGGKVYVGTGLPDDKLRVFDAATGAPAGTFQLPQPVESAPAASGRNIYFGVNDGGVYALDAASLLPPAGWNNSQSAGSFGINSVAVSSGVIYALPGHDDKMIYALDAATGNTIRKSTAGVMSVSWQTFTSPAAAGDRLYFSGAIGESAASPAGEDYLSALDTGTLASVWASSPSLGGIANMGMLSSPALAGELLYQGTVDGRLVVISSAGAAVAALALSSAAYSSPAVSDGFIYIGDMNGVMHGFSAGRTAALSAPEEDAVVSGSVAVSGYASNPAMTGYSLDYSTGGSPEVWHNIVSSNTAYHAPGSELGGWDASALPNGYYDLRLSVLETGTPAYADTAVTRVRVDAPPEPPSGLTAADVPNDTGNRLMLCWTASPTPGVAEYRVYRDDGTGFSLLASTAPSPLCFTDASAVTGSTFTYAVRAYDGFLESANSGEASAFSVNNSSDTTPPAAVADLSATPGPAPGMVTLRWTASGNDGNVGTASGYVIKYTTSPGYDWAAFDPGAGLQVSTAEVSGPAGTSEVDGIPWLLGGVTYYFALEVLDYVPNYSPVSNVASAAAARDTVPPLPPSGLTAADTPGDAGGSITLSWTGSPDDGAGANDVYGYRIYRSRQSGVYVTSAPYAEAPRGATGYKDPAATENVRFFYEVAAFNSTLDSAFTPEASAVSIDNYRYVDAVNGGYFLLPDGARVDIPGNAILGNASVLMVRVDPATYEPLRIKAAANAVPTGIVYKVAFDPASTRLLANATVTLPYTDSEVAGMDQENLRLYTLADGSWKMLNPSGPDTQARRVSGQASSFSLFSIMEYLPSGEVFRSEDVYTYPNPARGDTLYFKALVAYRSDITVDVYDVAGEKVGALEQDGCLAGEACVIPWDVKRIASGVYIYRLTARSAAGSKTLIKKLAIIH